MKKIVLALLTIFLCCPFAIAGNTFPLPGGSIANTKLQSDTLSTSYAAAATKVTNCSKFSVVNTKVLKQPTNGSWDEEWTVNACGKKVYVPITFILTPTGATYMISPRKIHF